METIEEYRARKRLKALRLEEEARKTGIACPKCAEKKEESEMIKPNPFTSLPTMRPCVRILCPKCGYEDAIEVC